MHEQKHSSKKVWPEAKGLLRKIPYADSQRECERLRDQFVAVTENCTPTRQRRCAGTGSGW